jgi:trk system potassium uptake protein TrkA
MKVPESFVNKTLRELGFSNPRDKYGLAVLAIKRGRDITLNPDIDDTIRANDVLILAGKDELLERLPS